MKQHPYPVHPLTQQPFSLLTLILILVLLLAACGGSAEPAANSAAPAANTADTAAPAATTAPAATATPAPTPTPTLAERLDRAEAAAEAEDFGTATAELEAVLAQEPDHVDALAVLGGILLTQERVDEALVHLRHALEVEPGHALALANLCGSLALQGAADALDTCQQALAVRPDDADVHNSLGILYGQQEQFDEAIAAFEQAIALDPGHNWAHNNLGRTYVNMGRYADGIAALQEALRITPDNARAHYNLALAYAQTEQYAAAVPEYEAALQYDPGMVLTYIDLAVVHTRMEQYDAAIAAFGAYLEQVPDADNRAAVEAEIARLTTLNLVAAALAAPETVDHANPASVLLAVFTAAANGEFTGLADLCDPLGQNDGDTSLICEITPDHPNAADFVQYFANGRIDGQLTITGDTAELPFRFGPDAATAETMQFILRDGKWYLFGF
ncbi:MAG: tetratricopeptide repeat protein [Anaerolineales bacterium]|nr:tetratricopeptide repeat protein [Anaerolineales bacterium]